MTTNNQTEKKEGLTIIRHFNAPKQVVFDAFATGEAMGEWWGPAGMDLIVKSFEFKPGGKFHYKMEANGQSMWGIFKYITIKSPELIEFINSFSDEEGNICTSPFPMDFPLEIFNRITLTDDGSRTKLTLTGHPINATAEQEATYYSIIDNMHQGFAGTFDKLDKYLETLKK